LAADGIEVEGFRFEGGADLGVLIKSSYNLLENNGIYGFPVGIRIAGSRSNVLTGNEIGKNELGLFIEDSDGLEIYLNNLIENRVHAQMSGSSATWTSNQVKYSYGGNTFSGFLGNYWSGYSGTDENGDGIGDKPYTYTSGSPGTKNTGRNAATSLSSGSNSGTTVIDKAPLISAIQNYDISGTGSENTYLLSAAGSSSSSSNEPEEKPVVEEYLISVDSPAVSPSAFFIAVLLFLPALAFSAFLFQKYGVHSEPELRKSKKVRILVISYLITGIIISVFSLSYLVQSEVLEMIEKSPGILILYFIWVFCGTCTFFAGYSLYSGTAGKKGIIITAAVSVFTFIAAAMALAGEITGLPEDLSLYIAVLSLASMFISIPATGVFRAGSMRSGTEVSRTKDIFGRHESSFDMNTSGTKNIPGFLESGVGDDSLSGISETTYFPQSLYQRYSEVSYVGMGGIARVFKGRRNSDGMTVAIKIPINFDENTGKLFIREMRVWENLEHPNIVKLYSFNILPVPFVEMEYIPKSLSGFSLPLSQNGVLRIVRDISLGLSYAHKQGIIHRDIKPHNILVTEGGVAKVTDWGLAKLLDDRHESTVGGFSLYYAAPEQLAPDRFGKPNERTDIYQIGVLVYELLIGLKPFTGGGVADITDQILYGRPMSPSENRPEDAPFDYLVMKCLEKNPENRFGSVDEILEELDKIARRIKGDVSENDLFS
ncbi:MAG: protein kinase, partial [Methanomicrobiaceae archaeon]|nr:protein kinase [Methanomicrobiaceae archaeon]